MSERFFLAEPPSAGRGRLVGDEARHLIRVMRCRVGDEVVVFDGRGTSWRARVASIGRDEAVLELGAAAEELAAVDAAGGRRVSLGPHVLRIETAAIALAARLA